MILIHGVGRTGVMALTVFRDFGLMNQNGDTVTARVMVDD